MFNIFIITLREGVEIAVILAIILAYIKQLGQVKESGKVWLGAGAAALVSILAAAGIYYLLKTVEIEGFQAILEGTLKIVAVVMLTAMTIWMKRQGSNIGNELKNKISFALSNGSLWALSTLVFISVIREGIETVLFIVSTAQGTPVITVVMGCLLGFGIAAAMGFILYRGTHHLPLKSFFTIMSILLIFMADGLLAGGIGEFQELHFIPTGIEHLWSTKSILMRNQLLEA
jgi:high-affinity iron transporter